MSCFVCIFAERPLHQPAAIFFFLSDDAQTEMGFSTQCFALHTEFFQSKLNLRISTQCFAHWVLSIQIKFAFSWTCTSIVETLHQWDVSVSGHRSSLAEEGAHQGP